jgi:hypothetical protein
MKLFIHKNISALVVASLCLVGCQTNTKTSVENDITFDSIQVEKVYHLFDNPDNPNCNFQLKFTYPVKVENSKLLPDIQKQFVENYFGEEYEDLSPKEAVAKYTDDYLASYKELEEYYQEEVNQSEGKPTASWFSYYEMSENEIRYNKNDILSYSINFTNYTGGAHGAHSTNYHVIDLKTGKAITEEAIFVEDYEEQLAQILVDKIAELNDVQDAKELENIGFFSIDEIFPNDNFFIDETGLTYAFNEYEIAAYVVGLIEVHIPFHEIEFLLKKESPIAHLVF